MMPRVHAPKPNDRNAPLCGQRGAHYVAQPGSVFRVSCFKCRYSVQVEEGREVARLYKRCKWGCCQFAGMSAGGGVVVSEAICKCNCHD